MRDDICDLFFASGQCTDAKLGAAEGEEAVFQVVRWPAGDFEIDFNAAPTRTTISRTTTGLLMEALRLMDENSARRRRRKRRSHRKLARRAASDRKMVAANHIMRVSILTISDSVASGKSDDRSGPAVAARCKELGWTSCRPLPCLRTTRIAIEDYLMRCGRFEGR